jgi:hypothetical protein
MLLAISKRIKMQRVGDAEPIQHNGIFGKSPECALFVVKAVCRLLALDCEEVRKTDILMTYDFGGVYSVW